MATLMPKSCRARGQKTPDKAFTLIELLVVLILIGLMISAIQVGWTTWIVQSRLESAAREIGSFLGLAIAQAIRTGETLEIVYDTETQRYYFQTPTPQEELSAKNNEEPMGDLDFETNIGLASEALRIRYLPEGVRFKDVQTGTTKWEDPGIIRLTLSPMGVTSDHILHLIDDDGREFSVEFNTITSQVTFHEGYKEYELETSLPATK